MKFLFSAVLMLLILGCTTPPEEENVAETTISTHGGPLILVHYMPWYRGPSTKSQENNLSVYGGHWTDWTRYNPAANVTNGKAQIQAKQYPLTGPYHSGNTALLEYQASLMKIAGIDGVIFDWYGSYDINDFGEIHEYTKAMVAVLKRAGLKFLVCYEDNTLNMMHKSGEEALNIGKTSFDWAQTNWFKDAAYVRYSNRPVVLCFGPQHFKTKDQWDFVFSGAEPKPLLVVLEGLASPWSEAAFNWPPVSSGTTTTRQRIINELNNFFNKQKSYRVVSVFSAFDDYYPDRSYGSIPYGNGEIFDLTWKKAVDDFDPALIQIVTWNDYGEGTIIEPTMERGYNELEYIQARVKEWNPGFPYTKEDLRRPLELYKLRYTQTGGHEAEITAAVNALFAGNAAGFRGEAAKTGISVDLNDLKPLLRN